MSNKKRKALFFYKKAFYDSRVYLPTTLTIVISITALFFANCGNAFCLLRWLDENNMLNIDWTLIQWASPVLGHIWLNLLITLICFIVLEIRFKFREGGSGRTHLVEKIKWGKNRTDAIAAEHSIFREYERAYQIIEEFFNIRNNMRKPGAWSMMNQQLSGLYDMLSMHMGKRTLPTKDELNIYDKEEHEIAMDKLCAFNQELQDLMKLWFGAYGFKNIGVGYNDHAQYRENMIELAKALGINTLIDGYYAGVPIDDLLI